MNANVTTRTYQPVYESDGPRSKGNARREKFEVGRLSGPMDCPTITAKEMDQRLADKDARIEAMKMEFARRGCWKDHRGEAEDLDGQEFLFGD